MLPDILGKLVSLEDAEFIVEVKDDEHEVHLYHTVDLLSTYNTALMFLRHNASATHLMIIKVNAVVVLKNDTTIRGKLLYQERVK